VLLAILMVGGIIALALPVFFGVAWSRIDIETMQPDTLFRLLLDHPLMISWIIVGVTVLIIVAVAVHAFVQAGSVGIYIDGERLAGETPAERGAFRAFSPERWWTYGRSFWWPVFLIYNIAWGIFGLILIVPLLAMLVAVVIAQDNAAVAIVGCLGVLMIFMVLIVGGIAVTIWCDLAIAETVRSGATPRQSLNRAGVALKSGIGDVLIIVAVLFAISVAVMGVSFGAYVIIGLGSSIPGLSVLFFPVQILMSFAQNAFSVFIAAWFIAAFASVILKNQKVLDAHHR
jgi:hypothetical protein